MSRVAATCVETSDAARLILAARESADGHAELAVRSGNSTRFRALQDMFRGDAQRSCAERFPELRAVLQKQPILVHPLGLRNGPAGQNRRGPERTTSPVAVARLSAAIGTAGRDVPVDRRGTGHGEAGKAGRRRLRHRVRSALRSRLSHLGRETLADVATDMADETAEQRSPKPSSTNRRTPTLIESLQTLTESLLKCWLKHEAGNCGSRGFGKSTRG